MNLKGAEKMKYNLVAASETAFYDMEAEAVWINFFLTDYKNGKLDLSSLKKINFSIDRLTRLIAHFGKRISNEDIEIDLPTYSGDQVGSVVYFFKQGEMPEEKYLQKYANKAKAE